MSIEAMKQALELALEELENCADLLKVFDAPFDSCIGGTLLGAEKAITAIKEALAQPAQEPVVDAARYQHIKGMARAMSLDMGGNHYWYMSLRNIRGPNLDEAIDRSIRAKGQA